MANKLSTIVLAIDGLRASSLGAYGNTWYSTPALDHLAATGTLFDQFHLSKAALAETYQQLWSGENPASNLAQILSDQGFDTLFVTDDPAVHGYRATASFERIVLAPSSAPNSPAEAPDQTATAGTLALLLDQIEQTAPDAPLLAWTHLRFASGPWDAPLDAIECLREEDDPEPSTTTTPPEGSCSTGDDFAFDASLRYAAQIMALDHCLGVTTSVLDQLLGEQAYRLILLGTRGYALGEHGTIGTGDQRPYSESRQVPLLVRPGGAGHHARNQRYVQPADLLPLLTGAKSSELDMGHTSVQLESPDGDAYLDEHWKLYAPHQGAAELYSKPDDRWEANDVASRHHDLIEERVAKRG